MLVWDSGFTLASCSSAEFGARPAKLQTGLRHEARLGAGVYGPTNVVTLAAGSVATKAPPPTVMLACSARFRPADVTHRATEFAVNPFSAKSSVTAEAF